MDSRRSSIPHFNSPNQQNAALICRTSTSYQFRRFYFQMLRKTNIVSSITKDLNPFHFHRTKPYKSNHHPTPIILSNNLQKKSESASNQASWPSEVKRFIKRYFAGLSLVDSSNRIHRFGEKIIIQRRGDPFWKRFPLDSRPERTEAFTDWLSPSDSLRGTLARLSRRAFELSSRTASWDTWSRLSFRRADFTFSACRSKPPRENDQKPK